MIETTGKVVPHRVLAMASEVDSRTVLRNPQLRTASHVHAAETLITIDSQRFAMAAHRIEIALNQAGNGANRVEQRQANLSKPR